MLLQVLHDGGHTGGTRNLWGKELVILESITSHRLAEGCAHYLPKARFR
jgi:hypothetical protein